MPRILSFARGSALVGLAVVAGLAASACSTAKTAPSSAVSPPAAPSAAVLPAALPDLAALQIAPPQIPDKTFNVIDYGAVADGKSYCTAAIQKAINECVKSGGGTVLVPPGKYLTGPLTLGNNLNLEIDKGAKLLLTDDPDKYQVSGDNSGESREGAGRRYQNCIGAENCHDLEISGAGTIDGQGAAWWDEFRSFQRGEGFGDVPPHRPYMIALRYCRRVWVRDVTLTNSPMFHLVPQGCQDVTIEGIHISAPAHSPNTDGIDPSGTNYHIKGCTIDTGDDNIALKPVHGAIEGQPACQNFLIEDCTFLHGHGMSIGGQTPGGLQNMLVRNCTFKETDSGIRMKAPRGNGGLVENVEYDNLTMTGVKYAITITSFYPLPKGLDTTTPKPVDAKTPIWRHIRINNVTANGGDNAGRIIGVPELHISDIALNNVKISAKNPLLITNADDINFQNSQVEVSSGPPLTVVSAKITGIDPTTGKPN